MTRFKTLIASLLAFAAISATAQTAIDGTRVDARIYGIYRPYDESAAQAAPKAPAGYKLCYLSHYGRHGARYLMKDEQYEHILDVLETACKDGKLTAEGMKLREDYLKVYPMVKGRASELTTVGQEQHHGIARRMMTNYPSLFKGKSHIAVQSTNLERTMLSMFAFCNTLMAHNGKLQIEADAPRYNIYVLNPHSVDSPRIKQFDLDWRNKTWKDEHNAYIRRIIDTRDLAARLFTDPAYAQRRFDLTEFGTDLYYVATSMEGMPFDYVNLFGYFTSAELRAYAECDNYWYYMAKGPHPRGLGRNWALAGDMLESIIELADKDMAEGTPVRLRFGHDGCIMAMYCMMQIDGWSTTAASPEDVWNVWDSSLIPMASNIQIAFYKGRKDTLINFRFNERDLKLPMDEVAPGFYSWTAFKEKYAARIAECKAILERTDRR